MNKKIVYVISVGSSLLAIVAIRANKTISLKASVVLLTCMSVKQFLGAEYTGTCLASFQIDALKSNNLYFITCILITKLFMLFKATVGETWPSSRCSFGRTPMECADPCPYCCSCGRGAVCTTCICECCCCSSICRCEHCFFDLTETEDSVTDTIDSAGDDDLDVSTNMDTDENSPTTGNRN